MLLCCVLCAGALCQTIECGFYVADFVRNSFALNTLVCLVAQGLLHIEVFAPNVSRGRANADHERTNARYARANTTQARTNVRNCKQTRAQADTITRTQTHSRVKIATRVAYVLVSIVFIALSVTFTATANPVEDVPENYFVCTCIFVIVNAVVFALSRKRTTTFVLFVAGCIACAYIQLLFEFNMTLDLFLFVVTCFVLMALGGGEQRGVGRQHGINQRKQTKAGKWNGASEHGFSQTGTHPSSQTGMRSSSQTVARLLAPTTLLIPIIYSACICALAFGVAFCIIEVVHPSAVNIELTTEYMAYPEDKVRTAVSPEENPDERDQSNNIDNDDSKTTTDKQEDENSQVENGAGIQEQQNEQNDNRENLGTSELARDAENSNDATVSDPNTADDASNSNSGSSGSSQGITALALNTPTPWFLLIIALIALAVVILYVLPYAARYIRLRKIQKLNPASQITHLYKFFIARFAKLGIARPATTSAIDFANLARARISPYAGSQSPGTFDHLTALYIEQTFGNAKPSPEDLKAMYYLYWQFYKNARTQLGWFKFRFRHIML